MTGTLRELQQHGLPPYATGEASMLCPKGNTALPKSYGCNHPICRADIPPVIARLCREVPRNNFSLADESDNRRYGRERERGDVARSRPLRLRGRAAAVSSAYHRGVSSCVESHSRSLLCRCKSGATVCPLVQPIAPQSMSAPRAASGRSKPLSAGLPPPACSRAWRNTGLLATAYRKPVGSRSFDC
jgi:hypothetical protein